MRRRLSQLVCCRPGLYSSLKLKSVLPILSKPAQDSLFNVFQNDNSTRSDVIQAGEKIIIRLIDHGVKKGSETLRQFVDEKIHAQGEKLFCCAPRSCITTDF